MVVVNIATAPLWPLSFLFAKRTHYYSYGEIIKRIEIPESVEQIMLISFFLVGAAMFQIEFIIYQRWEIKRRKRLEKKRRQQEINDELSQIKAEIDRKRKEKIAKCKRKVWISQNKK